MSELSFEVSFNFFPCKHDDSKLTYTTFSITSRNWGEGLGPGSQHGDCGSTAQVWHMLKHSQITWVMVWNEKTWAMKWKNILNVGWPPNLKEEEKSEWLTGHRHNRKRRKTFGSSYGYKIIQVTFSWVAPTLSQAGGLHCDVPPTSATLRLAQQQGPNTGWKTILEIHTAELKISLKKAYPDVATSGNPHDPKDQGKVSGNTNTEAAPLGTWLTGQSKL